MTNLSAPRWERLARLSIRLNRHEPLGADDAQQKAQAAADRLCQEARFNDILLREALAVFVAGAERGKIGARAADSLRLAIRQCDEKKMPFRGVRLRGRRRPTVDRSRR
jgi:hypothetical protein